MPATARGKVQGKPALKVALNVGDSATPERLKYRTTYIEGRTPGFSPVKGRINSVGVYVSEWDWHHSAVYLSIRSRYRLENGHVAEGAFEEPIGLEQLDQIIEMLVAAREKAARIGILTLRKLPKAKSA